MLHMGGNQPRYNSEIFLVAARSTGLGVCGAGKLYGCQSSSHLLPGDSLGGGLGCRTALNITAFPASPPSVAVQADARYFLR